MPVYEYECGGGHARFELKQGFDAEPVAPCPTCGQASRRVIHAVGVVFKGSGWYSTDSRGRRDEGEGKPAEAGPKAEGGQKTEKKEEPTKAAATSEPKTDASKESSTSASAD